MFSWTAVHVANEQFLLPKSCHNLTIIDMAIFSQKGPLPSNKCCHSQQQCAYLMVCTYADTSYFNLKEEGSWHFQLRWKRVTILHLNPSFPQKSCCLEWVQLDKCCSSFLMYLWGSVPKSQKKSLILIASLLALSPSLIVFVKPIKCHLGFDPKRYYWHDLKLVIKLCHTSVVRAPVKLNLSTMTTLWQR